MRSVEKTLRTAIPRRFSTAKTFGANPYLGAVIGGILINPSLQSAYTMADGVGNTYAH